ncbi:hypothetical protein MKEN_01082500 [Mycena kentingensis (nom. inval.)]|nr:hypothetical protein MKEN_01082500 [Mycena kentingensis (nom. inval.)]
MPPTASLRPQALKIPTGQFEDAPLLVPSETSTAMRSSEANESGLVDRERRLRHSQCKDTLTRLRNHLHLRSRLLIHKHNDSRHQSANSQSLFNRNEEKIQHLTDTYSANRSALQLEDRELWPPLYDTPDHTDERKKGSRWHLDMHVKHTLEDGALSAQRAALNSSNDEESEGEVVLRPRSLHTVPGRAMYQYADRVEWREAYARTRRLSEERQIREKEWLRYPVPLHHDETRLLAHADDRVFWGFSAGLDALAPDNLVALDGEGSIPRPGGGDEREGEDGDNDGEDGDNDGNNDEGL